MGYLVQNVNFSLTASLTALRTFGLWAPASTGTKRLLYYCYGFFCFMFVLGTNIICQIGDLFQVWGDLSKMTATACLLLTNLVHFTKIMNIIVRRPLIQNIIDNAELDLTSEIGQKGKEIVKSCNYETKCQQILFHSITFVCVIGWASAPKNRQLPVRCWYPFDVSISPAYEIAYTHQVIAILISGYLNVAKDTLVVSLIAQCHCRLRLLALSLQSICNDISVPEDRLFTMEQENILMFRLQVNVRRHQAALEAVNQLQRAFSEPTLIQFTVSLVIICVSAFQMVSHIGNSVLQYSMVLYLFNMMYQLFIYCYQGNRLAEESTAVAAAVYSVPWYACRASVRRSLVIMSIRSHRVALLVAGGFTPLSLSSFMSITKTSYSLFTLLQQVVEKN